MLTIRKARAEEYDLLPALESDAGTLFRSFGLPHIADMPPTSADDYRHMEMVFIAVKDEMLAGFCALKTVDGQAYLRELSVTRAHAHQGIGKQLLGAAITWARTQGFKHLTLTTFCKLPFNEPFYAKRGFRPFTPDAPSWPELAKICAEEKAIESADHPRTAMILNCEDV